MPDDTRPNVLNDDTSNDDAAGAGTAEVYDIRRREALARLGKAAGYAAPVTVALLSMKAVAGS